MVAQDILMVENQIPLIVLKEIHKTIYDPLPESSTSVNDQFSHSVFQIFCEAHSPLKLSSVESKDFHSVDHLLNYMYLSILNNGTVQTPPKNDKPSHHRILEEVAGFISKIPTKEIGEIYEQTLSVLETFFQTEPLIPSASKLRDKAGFQFNMLNDDEGIQSINFQGLEIDLPALDLNRYSEAILRNRIIYEMLTSNSDSFPLNEYMGLMCALLTNTEDAGYLKSRSVIVGELGDDEVAKLFVEMSGCIPTVETIGRSRLRIKVIDEINRVYESGLEMKMYLLMKKVAGWLVVVLRAIGGLVESSWKIVAFVDSVVIVLLLVTQAYCDVYGCDKKKVS